VRLLVCRRASGHNVRVELPIPDRVVDSGNKGCGELLMEVAPLVRSLAPGTVLGLVNSDPAADLDLQAGCRMTGHEFLGATNATPPMYLIRRA